MTVPMTGSATRYIRAGVALAVAAAAVVGSATASSAAAQTVISGTASPLTGAASTVITVSAGANTFKSATGVSKVNTLSTAANSVLFTVAACPTNTIDGSSNVTTAPPAAAKMLTDLVTHDKKTITTAAGTFVASDVGKTITSSGSKITAGTMIASVSADGKSATLSADAAAAGTALTFTITNGVGVGVTDGVTYDGTDLKIYSKQAANAVAASSLFNLAATGSISGNGIAAGATFTGVSPGTIAGGVVTVPASATLAGSGVVSGGVLLATATGNGAYATTSAPVTAATAVYPAAAVTVVSGTKLIVKAPAFAQAGAYNVCVFDSTTGTAPTASVIASGSYTAANVLASAKYTVATAPSGITVLPSSGPSGSATTLTITGTALGTTPTATLGGTALALKAVTGQANTFSATAPAHAPGATALVVSTNGGPAPAATFTYLDGITVQPTTMVAGTSTVLDITGAGFLTGSVPLTFDSSDLTTARLTDANAHVFLVKGQFVNITGTTNLDSAECTSVTVVSDLELICTLDGTGALGVPTTVNTPNAIVPNGAYQVVLVSSAVPLSGDPVNAATYRQTIITSASTFTVAPY